MIVEGFRLADPENIPSKFGVIFIDCWEFDWQWAGPQGFYHNIKQRLSQFPIDSKVFHTTCLKIDSLRLDVLNYFRSFVESHPKQLDNFKSLLDNAGDQTLSPELWELVDHKSIFIPSAETFQEHVVKSGVQHWIVVGCHWGICMHTKPLGFNNLWSIKRKHPKIDFYTIPDCVARWKWTMKEQVAIPTSWHDLHDDNLMWSKYYQGLARLEVPAPDIGMPKIRIISDDLQNIKNHQGWQITSTDSSRGLVEGLIPGRPGSLEMAIKYHHEHDREDDRYVLFVTDRDVEIDMRDLLCEIDREHTVFIDPNWRYALYRSDKKYKSRFLASNK